MVSKHAFSTLVSIPILVLLKFMSEMMPYKRQGFFCDDDEIRYPFREDSIKSRAMELIFLVIGCFLFAISEYSLIRHLTQKGKRLLVKSAHPFVYSFIFLLASYICSALCTIITTTFAKRTICRLRPNFLAVCQPNLTLHCPMGSHVFVEDYVCYGRFSDDEYYSFPSGHSSSAANFSVFLIIYLQKRNKLHEVIRSFLQFAIFLFCVYILSSRVRDYKHRLTDVFGGALLGSLFAIYFVTHVLNNFKANRYEIRDDDVEDIDDKPIHGHINHPIYPTIHINNKISRAGPSSEYGSLEDSDRPNSVRAYDKI